MRRGSPPREQEEEEEEQEQRGPGEGGGRAAAARAHTPERASPAYDSDSYENHVIDLREKDKEPGKEQGMDWREDGIEEEEHLTGSEGDDYEGDKDGSNAEATSASPDRGLEGFGGHRGPAKLEYHSDDDVAANGHDSHDRSPGEDTRMSAGTEVDLPGTGEGTSQDALFAPGEVVWAKFGRFPWWPAQVRDERDLNEDFKGDKHAAHDLAVRFFGTYDHAWVDPNTGLSKFDVKLQERSRKRKKLLAKGVQEAVEFRTSGKLPLNWDGTPSESEQSSQKADANGTKGSQDGSVQAKSENGEPEKRRASRTRKPKVQFEVCHTAGARKKGAKVKERSLKEEDIGHRRPEKKLRRTRIMRFLGLAAPYGSPFSSETAHRTALQS